ncbi:MAG TPA: hypothetical protein VFF73_21065 [Planctomycetota bacterium]|nr:hypothetical protein [Planctomycetota bacterium]
MGAGFHVLLEDPTVLASRTGEVARVVAKALAVPVPDVSNRVRYGGGVVLKDATEPVAREIAEKLRAAGMGAFVVPGAAVEALPRQRRLAGVVFDAEGLRPLIRGTIKQAEKLPWARVRALHVNAVVRELSPTEIEEGRTPRPIASVENAPEDVRRLTAAIDFWEDREKTKRIDLGLDVIADDPVFLGRVTAEEADYSELPGKKQGALENFVHLVRALLTVVPHSVVIPPNMRRFADACDWEAVKLEKPEERDAWNNWLLAAARHGQPFGIDLAEEVADDEVHDDAEEDEEVEDDEEEEEDDEEDTTEENVKAAGGDAELAKELALFDKTRKIRKKDVLDALEKVQGKIPGADSTGDLMGKETGKWDVSKVLEETKELEDKDI